MSSRFEVVIAGAGPTGLTLAAELAGAGIRCLVVERRAETSVHSRAFTVMPYTLELLDMRGQAEHMIQRGLPWRYAPFGDGKSYLDFGNLQSRYPFMLLLPQHDTEQVLEAWAVQRGATIERDARVTGVAQDDTGVTVEIERDGRTSTERALFVVGCDGAHSTVRGLVGIPFEGRSYDASLIIADVHLRHPPESAVHARISRRGMAAVFPFGDTRFRLVLLDHDRMHVPVTEAVTAAEIEESARALLGVDIGIYDPIWLSRFRSQQRIAPHYRKRRALLAGDAAHTHVPSGGQGLQIGMQDGFNLGWKLAAHIRGGAPAGLLDSYQDERRPIAAETLRQTDIAFRYETSRSRWVQAARQIAWRLMHFKGVEKSIIDNFAGFRLRYPQPRGAASHRLTGRRGRMDRSAPRDPRAGDQVRRSADRRPDPPRRHRRLGDIRRRRRGPRGRAAPMVRRHHHPGVKTLRRDHMASVDVFTGLHVPRTKPPRALRRLGMAFLILVAVIMVAGGAFVWRPTTVIGSISRSILWTKGVRGHDALVAGHRIHYLAGGQGRPAVLIHGLGGRAEDFATIMPRLMTAGFAVQAPDLLGYGDSDRPDVDYSIALEADMVRQFLDARKLTQVDLVGWSMGGWIALKLAAEHPERVRSLTLVDSAGFAFNAPDPRVLRPRTRQELETMAALFSPKAGAIPAFVARDMLRVMAEQDWVVGRALTSMYSRRDLMDGKLAGMTLPVHLVWGSRDVLTPLTAGYDMHRQIQHSTLTVIEGCGHVAMIECRDRVVPAMLGFLGGH